MKIKVTEDKLLASTIREALKKNDGYCPCRLFKTEDTKCICKEFREQGTPGPCYCGLYEKVEE